MTGPDLPAEGLQVCSGTAPTASTSTPHRGAQTRSVPARVMARMSGCATGANWDKAVLGGRKSFVRLHPLRHARLR